MGFGDRKKARLKLISTANKHAVACHSIVDSLLSHVELSQRLVTLTRGAKKGGYEILSYIAIKKLKIILSR